MCSRGPAGKTSFRSHVSWDAECSRQVWSIRLTIHVLANAGNALDAACLAGAAALRHFRRPDVEVIGEDVIVHDPAERAPVPLSLAHTPLCLTFAYFTLPLPSTTAPHAPDAPQAEPTPPCVLDPTLLEARLASGTMSLALTPARELVVLHKAGGVPLDVDEIMRVANFAGERVKELSEWLEGELRRDWEGRRGRVEVR